MSPYMTKTRLSILCRHAFSAKVVEVRVSVVMGASFQHSRSDRNISRPDGHVQTRMGALVQTRKF